MLDMGIIQKPSSPYVLSVVIIKKMNGSIVICIDYRKLNKLTILDLESIKTSEDLFQKLEKSQFFSKIDFSKGYWQIPVAEKNVFKTTFVTLDEAYEFLRMPFCIKNTGATLARGMKEVLSNTLRVKSYIDSLIVFFSNWKTHLKNLQKFLRRLSKANSTARPSKCSFEASV